jgi:hypothetical protein
VYFLVAMPNEVTYETNADWFATWQNLAKQPNVIVESTEKGVLWFRIHGFSPTFLLSPRGRLQVVWRSLQEKRVCLRLLRGLLRTANGEPLTIKPLQQQVWVRYPPPEGFKLFWCDEDYPYRMRALNKVQELRFRRAMHILGLNPQKGMLYGTPLVMGFKKY